MTCAVFPPGLVRASRGFSPAQCAVDIRPIETSIHSLAPVEAFHTRRGFFCAAMTARQGVMLYEIDPRDHNHRRAPLQPTAQVAFEHDLPVPISWPDLPSEIDRRNGWRDLPDVEQEVRTRAFGDAGVALRKIIGWLMQSKDAHAVGVKVIALAAAVFKDLTAGATLEQLAMIYGLNSKQVLGRPLRSLRKEGKAYYSLMSCSAESFRRKCVRQHVAAGHTLHPSRREGMQRRVILAVGEKAIATIVRERAGRYILSNHKVAKLTRHLGVGPGRWRCGLAEMRVLEDGTVEFKF